MTLRCALKGQAIIQEAKKIITVVMGTTEYKMYWGIIIKLHR